MSTTDPVATPVPAPIHELVAVFESQLAEIEFPGVSARSLREQVDSAEQAAEVLAAAEAALEAARGAHEHAYGELQTAAERALGYARVFAAGDPSLTDALKPITLTGKGRGKAKRGQPRLPPKKRSRPSKGPVDNVAKLRVQAESA